MDRSEVFVDAEVKVGGAARLAAGIVVSQALLELMEEIKSAVEKFLTWIVNTLGWSVRTTEELEEVLKGKKSRKSGSLGVDLLE